MRRYIVKRAAGPVAVGGQVDGTAWAAADVLEIDQYPWYAGGEKQPTAGRLLYDARALYFQFLCRDRHISSRVRQLNGPVFEDSCVEFFVTVQPQTGPDYFNLEINCCGVMHMGFGPGRHGRRLISPDLAQRLGIAASFAGPTKEESPDDQAWWAAGEIPLDALSEFVGRAINPSSGAVWRGNFYRCGGRTDPQYAVWNWIDAPGPDYHRPEQFGEIRFG